MVVCVVHALDDGRYRGQIWQVQVPVLQHQPLSRNRPRQHQLLRQRSLFVSQSDALDGNMLAMRDILEHVQHAEAFGQRDNNWHVG
eukprot:932058-Rhodomonas_salina.1